MKQLFLITSVLFSLHLYAQQIEVDLSNDKISNKNISSGTKELLLINTLTNKKKYKVQYDIVDKEIKPLINPLSSDKVNAVQGGGTNSILDTALKCPTGSKVKDAINDLNIATSEKQLQENYNNVNKLIGSLTGDCKKAAEQLLAIEDQKRKQSSFIEDLKPNQEVRITIKRLSDKDVLEKVWEFKLETESKINRWLIYYGFTYQPNFISKYGQFYSKADTSNANKFTVTKKNGNQTKFWENLSPTIMFTYLWNEKNSNLKFGVSSITATNFTTYSAGVGLSAIIGYNLNLSSGIMFTQKNVLNGQYKEGDIIKTNLTYDQLHEKKWGPEIYFTIGFRFDKNPFGGPSNMSSRDNTSTDKTSADKKTKDKTNSGSTGTKR